MALLAMLSMIAKLSPRPKLVPAMLSARPCAEADRRRAAATALPRSFASAAWNAFESASNRAEAPGAATFAAAESMIIFSSLNAG